jgi:hypothetical protein
MNSDATPDRPPVPSSDSVRRQVAEIAGELTRGGGATGMAGQNRPGDSSGQTEMTLYLALLADRLPVFVRTMTGLAAQVGQASVEANLTPVGHATIQFYGHILAAKIGVFTRPDQLLQLRRVLKSRDLGPHNTYILVSAYLEKERALGRIAADVDCTASAHLLIGACVNYAFTRMLLDEVTPVDAFVEQTVRGLRLAP